MAKILKKSNWFLIITGIILFLLGPILCNDLNLISITQKWIIAITGAVVAIGGLWPQIKKWGKEHWDDWSRIIDNR